MKKLFFCAVSKPVHTRILRDTSTMEMGKAEYIRMAIWSVFEHDQEGLVAKFKAFVLGRKATRQVSPPVRVPFLLPDSLKKRIHAVRKDAGVGSTTDFVCFALSRGRSSR